MRKESNLTKPLLSVCLITYNHVKYIEQAIEGVLMQQTNFSFDLIIADDFSIDGTREIVINYKKKYPALIKLILQQKNVGAAQNWIELITTPSAKYIAYFEGDDYWTDPLKLQKQVDFLEANEDYAICFHRVCEWRNGEDIRLSTLNNSTEEETYTIEDLAVNNFIHTPSVIFRNGLIKQMPDWFVDSPVGDYPLHMLNARSGKIKYLPEPMAVYRDSVGIWSTQTYQYRLKKGIIMLDLLTQHFDEANVLKNLVTQQVNFYKSLHELNDSIFLDKKQLVIKRLLDTVNEKDWELLEIKKRHALLLAKGESVKELLKALVKRLRIKLIDFKFSR